MSDRPWVLDGGLATELQRRGRPVRAPWWTASALLDQAGRDTVSAVHTAYVAAGADVITANTFRGNLRTAQRAAAGPPDVLIDAAVELARAATAGRVRVAGSMAPVEDCYRPDLVPPDAELESEHTWMAHRLARAGVDLVLAETMNTVREAVAATRAAATAGLEVWTSFVCTADARLLSGEDLGAAARAVIAAGAGTVLVNCTRPAATEVALRRLRQVTAGPIGAYPNVEDRSGIPPATPVDRYVPPDQGPGDLAAQAGRWRAGFGADVLGGCCGTTPEHIAALRRTLCKLEEAEPGPGTYRRHIA